MHLLLTVAYNPCARLHTVGLLSPAVTTATAQVARLTMRFAGTEVCRYHKSTSNVCVQVLLKLTVSLAQFYVRPIRHALKFEEEVDPRTCRRSQPSVCLQMDRLEAISWHLCILSQKLHNCKKCDSEAFDDLFWVNDAQQPLQVAFISPSSHLIYMADESVLVMSCILQLS